MSRNEGRDGAPPTRARTVVAVFAAVARSRGSDGDRPPEPLMPAYVVDALLAAWGADPRRLATLAAYFDSDA